ncbi:hypothetical protein NMY22_g10295 [Coprinellus aureogranulatus]|nr:hypothetical protein NMY22_g10295 [Coprinellus aureogranulatus]
MDLHFKCLNAYVADSRPEIDRPPSLASTTANNHSDRSSGSTSSLLPFGIGPLGSELRRILKATSSAMDAIAERVLAPIQRIPRDIVALIFLACLPDPAMEMDNRLDVWAFRRSLPWRSLPGVISLVCTEWRTLALHTPRLWSRIYVKTPEVRIFSGKDEEVSYQLWSKRMEDLQTGVKTWIGRSSPVPIELTLDTGTPDYALVPRYQKKHGENM